jgi:hypothetical protein
MVTKVHGTVKNQLNLKRYVTNDVSELKADQKGWQKSLFLGVIGFTMTGND